MEGRIPDQQRIIRAASNVLWTVQLAGNVSKNDEQYFLRIASWRDISKLYGRLRDTSQNHGGTRRKDNLIFEDSREVQPVFQKIKMRLQHGGNPYFRSGGWQRANCQDGWRWTWLLFFTFHFILLWFRFSFIFLFLEQLGLGFISHAVTSVTNWWRSHKPDHKTWGEGSRRF